MKPLPPTEFGLALQRFIRANCKSQAEFASRAMVDPTWVSQIIRGRIDSPLTYRSLLTLLGAIESTSAKEQLYDAWRATYAPSPSLDGVPLNSDSDEIICQFASSVHDLISAGRIAESYRTLNQLWIPLRANRKRIETTMIVGRALVEAAQHFGRAEIGKSVAIDMRRVAVSAGESSWVATGLWLEGVSARVHDQGNLESEAVFRDLVSYLRTWQPRSSAELRHHNGLVQMAVRDRALTACDIARKQGIDHALPLIKRRLKALRISEQDIEDSFGISLVREVASRAELMLGDIDGAAESLAIARRKVDPDSQINRLKILISEMELDRAIGDGGAADEKLQSALDIADKYQFIHHRQKLAVYQRGHGV